MAFSNGRGGYLTITTPTRDGVALTGTDPNAWAAGTTYVAGEMVLIGTGTDTRQLLCETSHVSGAGGLTNTGGTIGGTEEDNWRVVDRGLVYQLSNWTLDEAEETEAVTRTIDSADTTTSTTITATGTAEVFMDVDENIQNALQTGIQGAFKLYPHGKPTTTGQRYFSRSFDARITSVGEAFSTTPLVATINFSVPGGTITREIETVS